MILIAPREIATTLYEGPLVEDGHGEPSRVRGPADDILHDLDDLPVVTLGKPEIWPVSQLFGAPLPPAFSRAQGGNNFSLVRLAFSLRLRRRDRRVDWVRLAARLEAGNGAPRPIVFDIHPRLETQQVRHDVKVSMSPSVKFSEVEASIGSADHHLEYQELLPVITGSGIGESLASWDFESSRGIYVSGARIVHVIVSTEPTTTQIDLVLTVAANVVGPGFQLPVVLRRERAEASSIHASLEVKS